MTMGNGPNDAGHVVWALGECLSFFFHSFLLILMHVFLHIQLLIYILRDMVTGRSLRRWEMAQTRTDMSFGPLVRVSNHFKTFYPDFDRFF